MSKEEEMEEQMFLGLRIVKGVNKEIFYERFSVKLEEKFGSQIQKLVKQGLLVNDDESLFLTHKGKLLGNEVFQEFLIS